VWTSYDQDGSGGGVYAQRYDASGNALGSEFRINTYTASDQYNPHVAMAPDGRFVVVWTSYGQDHQGAGVYGQRYDASGNPQGTEFRVNTYTTDYQWGSSIAIDTEGRFAVVWMSNGQDGSGQGVYAQRYDASGNPQGAEFHVNTYTTSDQSSPHIAMDSNARFVVAWMSDGQDGDGYGIYSKLFDCIQDYDCPSGECNDGVCLPLTTTTTTTHPTTTTTTTHTGGSTTTTHPPTTTSTHTTTTTTTTHTGGSTTTTHPATTTTTHPPSTTTTSSTTTTHTGGTTTSIAPTTSTTTTTGGGDDDTTDDDLDDADDDMDDTDMDDDAADDTRTGDDTQMDDDAAGDDSDGNNSTKKFSGNSNGSGASACGC